MKNDDLYKQIGKNVKKIRIEKGLTQLELALNIGLKSDTFVSLAEVGKSKHFNINHIIKIAKIFDCTIDELVSYPENHSEWLDESIYNED